MTTSRGRGPAATSTLTLNRLATACSESASVPTHARRAHKNVRNLVRQREHLSRLEVRTVDEYQRCVAVDEGETLEFSSVEPPVRIVADDPVENHQNAARFDAIAQIA